MDYTVSTQTLLYLADYFIVVGHTVVDQGEGIVARTTGVGSDQEPTITFRSLLEQGNSSLHIVEHIVIKIIIKILLWDSYV